MKLISERAKELDAFLRGTKEHGSRPLVIGGERKDFPSYLIPTALLRYNIQNGRFAAELKALQFQLKRELDPLAKRDAEEIRKLLLQQDPTMTQQLREEMKLIGQLEPGIVTHDGFVINGNRRMAIFEELHQTEPNGKWERIEVHRLPKGVGAKDLWRIEAGLQLSREKRLDYGPVNDLLKLREGNAAGMSPNEMAATMFGVSAEDVAFKLKVLALVDQYLEYIGKADFYMEVDRKVEHFISLESYVLDQGRKASVPKRDLHRFTLAAFNSIKDGTSHLEVRKLKEVLLRPELRGKFCAQVLAPGSEPPHGAPAATDPGGRPEQLHLHETISTSPEETDDLDAPKAGSAREAVADALEEVKIAKEKDKPAKLIDSAIRNLSAIDLRHPTLKEPGVVRKVRGLLKLAEALDKAASKGKKR